MQDFIVAQSIGTKLFKANFLRAQRVVRGDKALFKNPPAHSLL
jgi:hypothetical protein